MSHLRAARIAKIADDIPPLMVDDEEGAELLILGWGSTFGSIRATVRRLHEDGLKVASAHLFHLNPMPANTGDVLRRYKTVLIPEMNMGQLSKIIRAEFLIDTVSYNKVQGVPIFADELEAEVRQMLR
jgi:2-oxoglutarate ferredoxin oxidoreductase subunit alpha